MKISSVAEMRAMDRTAIEQYGIADELLMENAGEAAYFCILQHLGISEKRFLVFCGDGNNGGDGLVIARKILSNGGEVSVIIVGDPNRYTAAAKLNYTIIRRLPIVVQTIDQVRSLRSGIDGADVLIDALLGTGLTRKVAGQHRKVIDQINRSGKTVVSVDIPSGINGDTGRVMGTAVRAHYTVTFGLPKIGTILFPGCEYCGELFVSHISFPPQLYVSDRIKVAVNIPQSLPARARDGHKGTFGDVLFIAGSSSYFGAPCFAALSFLKAGGGYSRLAAPASMIPFLASRGSELVFLPQQETPGRSIALNNKKALLAMAAAVDMVVLGPGISLDPETQQLARELIREIHKPLLIDGDGITAFCSQPDIIGKRTGPTVITPHPGEMGRIVQASAAAIEENRIPVLQQAAQKLHATIVLKGAHSLIGLPDGRIFVNLTGNSGMATAGSGDVLNGSIAAMACLGLPLEEAVKKGVFIHGLAGDLAARDRGEDGITARDILEYLPLAMKSDREGTSAMVTRQCFGPAVI
ncbi:MAG TPA: NAD(P)H-hydrate dehydratase [Thermodesulfobacteriota bacterium]|nr:NAD(P)H-hydrate dehydratase [Thermodesulfobacteriota bacterium]